MRKKISALLIATFAIFTILPLSSAFAYSGGLLNGKILFKGDGPQDNNRTVIDVTDGNVNTSAGISYKGSSTDTFWYEFETAVNISNYQILANGANSDYKIYLYDTNGLTVGIFSPLSIDGTSHSINSNLSAVSNVKKIALINTSSGSHSVFELDFFSSTPVAEKSNISNVVVSAVTHSSAKISWDNPTDTDFTGTKVYKDGFLYTSSGPTITDITISNLTPETSYAFKVTSTFSDGTETSGKTVTATTKSPPPDRDNDGIQDSEDTYPDDPTNTPPPPDEDNDGIPDSEDRYPDDPTNTPQPVGEVKDLQIQPEYNKVKLSWKLPDNENFKNVTIYREVINQETGFLNDLFGSTVYAAALFETNGTSFTDLTVEPETEYEYRVTTTSQDGAESAGVTASTKTPVEPLIKLDDLKLPFTVKDLVESGNGLLWLVGPFVLLALAFLLFPKLRKLIVNSFRNNRNGKEKMQQDEAFRRFRTDEKEAKTIIKEKHEGKEHIAKTEKERSDRERQEREKREAAAAPKIKEPREPKERKRERVRAEKQPRREKAAREPRTPRMSARAAREPRRKRGAS